MSTRKRSRNHRHDAEGTIDAIQLRPLSMIGGSYITSRNSTVTASNSTAVTTPAVLTLRLPVTLGRRNLASAWWKACPRQCQAWVNKNRPCPQHCRPVRVKDHLEIMSRSMVQIQADGSVRITAKHADLVHWKGRKRLKYHPTKCQLLIGKDPQQPWMAFSVTAISDPREGDWRVATAVGRRRQCASSCRARARRRIWFDNDDSSSSSGTSSSNNNNLDLDDYMAAIPNVVEGSKIQNNNLTAKSRRVARSLQNPFVRTEPLGRAKLYSHYSDDDNDDCGDCEEDTKINNSSKDELPKTRAPSRAGRPNKESSSPPNWQNHRGGLTQEFGERIVSQREYPALGGGLKSASKKKGNFSPTSCSLPPPLPLSKVAQWLEDDCDDEDDNEEIILPCRVICRDSANPPPIMRKVTPDEKRRKVLPNVEKKPRSVNSRQEDERTPSPLIHRRDSNNPLTQRGSLDAMSYTKLSAHSPKLNTTTTMNFHERPGSENEESCEMLSLPGDKGIVFWGPSSSAAATHDELLSWQDPMTTVAAGTALMRRPCRDLRLSDWRDIHQNAHPGSFRHAACAMVLAMNEGRDGDSSNLCLPSIFAEHLAL